MGSIADIIAGAAQRYGQDPQTALGIARIESGLNPNAQNPKSSAGGLFQFIDGTASQYGLANRFDPNQAADAGARLLRDNGAVLQRALGRAPSPGELYLAHQQGAGGATEILANPTALAADTVGADRVRLNGGNVNMTNAQFAQLWGDKLAKALGQTGSPPAAQAGQAPQIGTSLADALPGATLPQGAFVIPAAAAPDPVGIAATNIAQQFQARQEADAMTEQARRAALFGGGVSRLYG